METSKNYPHQDANYIPKARVRKTNEFKWGNLHSDYDTRFTHISR